MLVQKKLFDDSKNFVVKPFKIQLLKWIGNKQRFAHEITSYFPTNFKRYFEPFLGSGAVLGTLAPKIGLGSDVFQPLMQIWHTLHNNPEKLKEWYSERWNFIYNVGKEEGYEKIKTSYNDKPNGPDLLFLCRACYGGVVRFRKTDGYMSTPCGVHDPISPDSFANRVEIWHKRINGVNFLELPFEESMNMARKGDLIYCDPPYRHSQGILYRGQEFNFEKLLQMIEICKKRGVFVALSIDGTKKSGCVVCDIPIPNGLFEQEIYVNCGRSMLKRFQMEGKTLEREIVSDRLLLTY